MMNKVPVILISGFLGSGKTTLLLRLLAHTRQIPLRAVVLMNEMGEYNVDSAIISEEMPDVTVEGLLEGCICCSKRNELAGALHTLLSQEPDLIFMETTGVANPEQVLEELRSLYWQISFIWFTASVLWMLSCSMNTIVVLRLIKNWFAPCTDNCAPQTSLW